MQDKDYTIAQVVPKDDWTGAYGLMKSYALKLEGVEDWVQVNQKPETPAPEVGKELFGHLESKVVGDKTFFNFKKVNKNYTGAPSGGAVWTEAEKNEVLTMLRKLTGSEVPAESVTDGGTDFNLDEIPF